MVRERRILGLDLGTNSIGWCLLSELEKDQPLAVVAMGSRVFPTPLEAKTKTPLNQQRRNARLARRRFQRRARRKRKLMRLLIKQGLLPASLQQTTDASTVLNQLGRKVSVQTHEQAPVRERHADVYHLRALALQERLEPFELGKILLSFASRRGFLSNKKTLLGSLVEEPEIRSHMDALANDAGSDTMTKEQAAEESATLQEIQDLQAAIDASGLGTLGAYLHSLGPRVRKRGLRTSRKMYRDEFNAIWTKQATYHPDLLTDHLKREVHHCIFFQRPLRFDSDLRGNCSLELRRKRAASALLEVQEFRIWQDINHLRLIEPTHHGEIPLSEEQRQLVFARLQKQGSISFPALRKLLQTKAKFNLEANKVKTLKGNDTAIKMRQVLAQWDNWPREKQQALLTDMLTIGDKRNLYTRLRNHWDFDIPTSLKIATTTLSSGYANLSRKAIRRLLPYLEQGERYDQARVSAGYGFEPVVRPHLARLPEPPYLRNPVVGRVLHQLRHLVNAVIRVHGPVDAIRIEMARDLALSKRRKDDLSKQQQKNRKANQRAEEQFHTIRSKYPELQLPSEPQHYHKLKYRLWEEAKERCVYTGQQISMHQLFSEATEIDHILPYSRTMDNSYMNKVLVMREANVAKGNRTPYEHFASDSDNFEQIKQRARDLSPPKRKRFFATKLDGEYLDKAIGSLLNDTRYVAREAVKYVGQVCGDVSVCKGTTTAMLRWRWGLHQLLGREVKNRDDHRHHAIDAAVIAATNRSLYTRIVGLAKQHGEQQYFNPDKLPIDPPWHGFRDDLKAQVDTMVVSRMPNRKLSGAFHEDTVYGLRDADDQKQVVVRKALNADFKKSDAKKVIDPALRDRIEEYLNNHDKFSDQGLLLANGRRVRRAKILVAKNYKPESHMEKSLRPDSAPQVFKLGNNHHVEILRNCKTGKVKSVFRSTLAVAKRVRQRGLPPVEADHGADWALLCALHIDDFVKVVQDKEQDIFFIRSIDPTDKRLLLDHHTNANAEEKKHIIRKAITTLLKDYQMQAVRVDILGRVR